MKFDRYIKTQEEYQEVLKEIDGLFDSEPGTPEDEKLEFLLDMADKYKESHSPREILSLKDALDVAKEERGLSSDKELAEFLGILKSTLSMMKNGHRPPSRENASLLYEKLHIPYEIIYGERGLKFSDELSEKLNAGEKTALDERAKNLFGAVSPLIHVSDIPVNPGTTTSSIEEALISSSNDTRTNGRPIPKTRMPKQFSDNEWFSKSETITGKVKL